MEGKERPEKEADHSRLVGGSFSEQGNLHTKLVLGSCKMRPPHPPTRILSSCRSPNGIHSRISSRWSQQHIALIRLCPWKQFPLGKSGQNIHSKDTGGGEEPPIPWFQVRGQPVVMSSWWPPPTLFRPLFLYIGFPSLSAQTYVTHLKQGPRVILHCMWLTVGRTWWQSSSFVFDIPSFSAILVSF